jgi:hypothetical protein
MGAASAKFDEITVTGTGVSSVQEIAQNIITNSNKLMKKLIDSMTLLDIPLMDIINSEYENSNTNYIDIDSEEIKVLKDNILKLILDKIKVFYTDKLASEFSLNILQKISKNLNYGIEIDEKIYQNELQQALKRKPSIKGKLSSKFGIQQENLETLNVPDVQAAKQRLADEIVSLFVDKFIIVSNFNRMLKDSEMNRNNPANQPNEYLEDYVNIYQSRFNVSGRKDIIDEELDKEIEFRYRNLSDALKTVYKDINSNIRQLNKAQNKKEVEIVKNQIKRSPNKNVVNLCKALDQACDISGIENIENMDENQVEEIKSSLNRNTRNKQFSSLCNANDRDFNLANLNNLSSPCKDPSKRKDIGVIKKKGKLVGIRAPEDIPSVEQQEVPLERRRRPQLIPIEEIQTETVEPEVVLEQGQFQGQDFPLQSQLTPAPFPGPRFQPPPQIYETQFPQKKN